MQTLQHTGFDLFFNNLSNKNAKILVQALNRMQRTMHGQTLTFKLNRKHPRSLSHQTNSTVITTRYKPVTANAADLMLGLQANRKIGEGFARAIGLIVTYEGSEFYVENCNTDDLATDMDNLINAYQEA